MCFGLSRSSGNARQMTLNTATDRCTHLIYGRVQGVLVINTSLSSQWFIIVITATWKYYIVVYETNSCKTKSCKWLKCVCSWVSCWQVVWWCSGWRFGVARVSASVLHKQSGWEVIVAALASLRLLPLALCCSVSLTTAIHVLRTYIQIRYGSTILIVSAVALLVYERVPAAAAVLVVH